MKPSMALKPLVFAIAAVMAIAVQAGQRDDEHHHRHHVNPKDTTNAGATANATDKQTSTNNYISNEGTKNTANMTNSATGASGNVGVNVAAGDGNQQDNAAAIASGDGSFVFGSVVATAKVTQTQNNNEVYNQSTNNSANMSGSANGGSGNMGINMAAGDLNQQKNTMAIAVSGGKHATATASADQSGPGLRVDNDADRTFRVDTLSRTVSASGHQSFQEASKSHSASDYAKYSASAFTSDFDAKFASKSASASASHADVKANLDANVDVDLSATRNDGRHHSSRSATFDADIDASLAASIDKSNSKSSSKSSSVSIDASGSEARAAVGAQSKDKSQSFSESSSFDLSNTVSWQVLTPTGWANPVTNTANLNGSVNGGSGNLGVNVAAGVGNQQSNSLSIASGCRTCL
ncbi:MULTISPECIES: heme utilization protein [unclassified Pseudomonas]|uniref:heme utilization protein n=1 Tax=unclassified Pseudomonas TaxID=196821 RepID=UPI000CD19254|nr:MULTISPECIES: heme utilization protein [unclassified Pseudomonas]POA30704.1 heme utilization protein [Pseudomonas sp. GW456-R21]POA66324.1 heme utilization protein [Pseudomonas sp. GW460-R15]